MKKTVTINISGIIFYIDEDAYDRLNRYLNSIKRHFSKMEGRDEVITDIEARIAELLQEKMGDAKQVITIDDIEEVIAMMGEPSEMDEENEFEPRPREPYTYRPSKRLFRDPDGKMVAGVSSGLSAYFNIDPVWFRVLFIVSLFATGAGLIAYIILWIVVPEAITTADKLEMRGEPVNISNIERSVRDEFENVNDKFNEFTDGAKETLKRKDPGHPTVFDNLVALVGGTLRIFLKVLVVLVGLVLVLSGLGFIIAFMVGSAGLSDFSFFDQGELISFSLSTFLDMVFPGRFTGIMSVVSLILIFGIPLLMTIYLGFRMIFGTRLRVPYIGITAFAFWLAGIVIGASVVASTAMDFRHSAIVTDEYEVKANPAKVLFIQATTDQQIAKKYSHNTIELFDGDWTVQFMDDSYILYAVPDFSVSRKSQNDKVTLEVNAFAQGSTRAKAHERAKDLIYQVSTNDSVINLATFYKFQPNAKIRGQEVSLKFRPPDLWSN